jgi:hypothetical protein
LGDLTELLRSTLLYLARHHRAEAVPPKPDRLVRDVDPTLMKQVFHIPQGQREPDVHHHSQTDHLRRRFEIAKRIARPVRLEANPITEGLI